MQRVLLSGVLVLGLVACQGADGEVGPPGPSGEDGADGADGEDGADGADGEDGAQGRDGPLVDPPRIESMSPPSGSWRNYVTITGEDFAESGNQVYFDGTLATVVSEGPTELVVQPDGAFLSDGQSSALMSVTVIAEQQASNAHAWLLLPSGTPRVASSSVPSQVTGVASDGDLVYLSDQLNGILAVDPENRFASSQVRGLDNTLRKPEAITFSPDHGLLVVDDVSSDGDNSRQHLLAIDEETGETEVIVGGSLQDAVDVAVDPQNGDIYIATNEDGASNSVVRVSDSEGVELAWGSADLDSDITSIAVVSGHVYVGGGGSNAGLFEFEAGAAGGGTQNQLKSLESGVVPTGLARDGAALFVLENSEVKSVSNLSSATSTVSTFNDAGLGGHAIANDGGTLYYAGAGQSSTVFQVTQDSARLVSKNPIPILFFSILERGGFAIGDDIYIPFGIILCLFTDLRGILRINAAGEMDVVSQEGSCNLSSAATPSGLIATSDALDDTVSVIDPESGIATVILNEDDGIEDPVAIMTGADGAIYVTHSPDDDLHLGLTDESGSSFEAEFVDLDGLQATIGESLGDLFVFAEIEGEEIFALDPETQEVSVFVEENRAPGQVMDMARTSEGSLVVSFTGAGVGLYELLETGAIWPLFTADPEGDIAFPLGAAQLSSGDYFMVDFDFTNPGRLIHVTP